MSKLERIQARKNFLPTVILDIFLLFAWLILFFLVPPEYFLMPVLFLLVTFLFCFFILSLIFGKIRRGLIASLATVIYMVFSFYGLGNLLNLILILGIAITIEFYFSKR